jgi:hypothetical protein
LQLPPISPEIHHPRKECLALIYDSHFNRHTHIGQNNISQAGDNNERENIPENNVMKQQN